MDPTRPLPRLFRPRRELFAAAGVTLALAIPARASAEPPPAPAPAEVAADAPSDADQDPEAGVARTAAPDTRLGHLLIDARVGYTAPAGKLAAAPPSTSAAAKGTATAAVAGGGVSFGGTVGVGLGRHAVVEATGEYSIFGGPAGCIGCKGHGFDVGLGLSYHLAQGIAVDPWASFGVGFRAATFTTPELAATGALSSGPLVDQTYRGLDVARIALGADFYPTPFLGLGPFFEVDLGTAVSRPATTAALGPAAYAFVQIGLRIALDPMRSSSVGARPASALARPTAGF